MELSQEEIVESSQNSSGQIKRGRPRRSGVPYASSCSQRRTKPKKIKSFSQQRSQNVFEIPESATEEDSANVSESLFSGQQDLLKHYHEHEENIKQRDVVLERVLEQSRKAYEQLKLQTESRDLFSEEATCQGKARTIQKISFMKEASTNTDTVEKEQVGIQVALDEPIRINQKDFGVQCEQQRKVFKNVSIQTSHINETRFFKDVSVQSSPERNPKRTHTSTATNTDQITCEHTAAQTNRIQTSDIGVQKYHSIRVREASVQATIGELARDIPKRNVCIQQRTSGLLELSAENALTLGIELKCDPAHLHLLMLRLAAKQNCTANETVCRKPRADFSEEDPYFANHAYFMEDFGGESSVAGSVVEGFGQEMSCCIEESMC